MFRIIKFSKIPPFSAFYIIPHFYHSVWNSSLLFLCLIFFPTQLAKTQRLTIDAQPSWYIYNANSTLEVQRKQGGGREETPPWKTTRGVTERGVEHWPGSRFLAKSKSRTEAMTQNLDWWGKLTVNHLFNKYKTQHKHVLSQWRGKLGHHRMNGYKGIRFYPT